jgi:hypothetical protein
MATYIKQLLTHLHYACSQLTLFDGIDASAKLSHRFFHIYSNAFHPFITSSPYVSHKNCLFCFVAIIGPLDRSYCGLY